MLRKLYWVILSAGLLVLACSKDGVSPQKQSGENKMLSFAFADLNPVVKGEIDTISKTVNVWVPSGIDLKSLKPTIEISSGASIIPASGVSQDFTNPVVYTITAANGNKQAIAVNVKSKQSTCLLAEAEITELYSDGMKRVNKFFYTYNASNVLQKIKGVHSVEGKTYSDSVSLSYNETGKLVKITNSRELMVDITYTGNVAEIIRTFPENFKLSLLNFTTYTLNNKGQVTKLEVSPSTYLRYEYNEKEQLEKTYLANGAKEYLYRVFEYDDKKNPYKDIWVSTITYTFSTDLLTGIPKQPVIFFDYGYPQEVQANNWKKTTSYYEDGSIVGSTNYTYTYNADGYPLTMTNSSGSVKTVMKYSNCSNN
ncbi:hypothetical protein [Emticicia sp. C21]|uniref:hypothetical protein n=1 Tax=Emticicia sp. C21 TaxID=2302915 RepID=UPI000E350BD8|nr:hypothetical protein [Emticicia sp. C21]RFS17594.1 hypothetical protein D0T08_07445 [Emticicia sp. C21]